jgi:hypothetical protein
MPKLACPSIILRRSCTLISMFPPMPNLPLQGSSPRPPSSPPRRAISLSLNINQSKTAGTTQVTSNRVCSRYLRITTSTPLIKFMEKIQIKWWEVPSMTAWIPVIPRPTQEHRNPRLSLSTLLPADSPATASLQTMSLLSILLKILRLASFLIQRRK